MKPICVSALIAVTLVCFADDPDYTKSLAYGRKVDFLPAPNYRLTIRDETDALDLTDGKPYTYHSPKLWFDRRAVGYSYAGQVQFQVDLGGVKAIDEVGIRLQGGRPAFPGSVEILVSDDGKRYFRVASCSKWNPGERERYEIPPDDGESRVVPVRFKNLKTRGRFVAFRIYCTSLTCSDELWVMAGEHDPKAVKFSAKDGVDFTTTGPQLYFNKPVVKFATGLALPIPIGMAVTEKSAMTPVKLTLDIPAGVKLETRSAVTKEDPGRLPKGQMIENGAFARYSLDLTTPRKSKKVWLRIYLTGNWPAGKRGVLRYRVESKPRRSILAEVPIEAIRAVETPAPKRIMTGLGWYSASALAEWPDWLRAFRALGFNTVSSFAHWMKPDDKKQWGVIARARKEGFRLLNIDSTFQRISLKSGEACCQFDDGAHGKKLCPSYRGKLYKKELNRVADETARMRPNYLFTDIELWNWRGPVDSKKCMRCEADFEKSGVKEWGEWQLSKGYEMWTDMVAAVTKACDKAGGPKVEFGCYDFEPGKAYQFFWPFDRLYPEYMQSSQVSTYTPLHAYHIAHVGDEVRGNREKLPRSDVLPWITPGDAGTFSGESFRYVLWECYANGARGVLFWSGRVWDPENLVAMARAIKAIVPVEDVIVDGDLVRNVKADAPARVSGMQKGDEMVLLVADYFRKSKEPLRIHLTFPKPSRVKDLDTGEVVGQFKAGEASLVLSLGSERARLLHVSPVE